MVLLTSKFFLLLAATLYASATVVHSDYKAPLRKHIVTRERLSNAAGAKRALNRARAGAGNQSIRNEVVLYSCPVGIGNQVFQLLLDSGSSAVWTGANNGIRYVASKTSVNLGLTFDNAYASGEAIGTEFNDTVTIGGLSVTNFPIGNASFVTSGLFVGDTLGILGTGPVDLTEDTVSGPLAAGYDTFSSRLAKQHGIPDLTGIFFHPESGSDNNDINGEITFGGVDTTKFKGNITFFPPTTTTQPPFNLFWSLDVQTVTYGNTVLMSSVHGAIVDTGTTMLNFPFPVYNAFLTASGGEEGPFAFTFWDTPPTLNLTLNIAGQPFTLTPEQYTIPANQLANYNLTDFLDPTKTWSYLTSGGPDDGFELNFIIGMKFLENFYQAYDGATGRVGFAHIA